MKKTEQLLKTDIIFFISLFVLLFLGDGKQSIIDVVGIAVVIFLWLSRRYYRHPTSAPLPSPLEPAWLLLLVYIALTTIFSISVGFSISSTIRYLMAYLIFTFFYSASIEEKQRFGKLLMWFCFAATLASLAAVIISRFGQKLPNMNLLYPAYGHNHIVDLIVFGLPLAIVYVRQKRNVIATLTLMLFGLALIFSFSRGALVLIVGYTLFRLFIRRDISITSRRTHIVLAVACLVGASVYIVGGGQRAQLTSFARRQVVKVSVIESRISYWKQALLAIRARPLLGAGPGTFYLLSKQYQDKPLTYSWYAHSFLLETAAESGIVGVVLIVFLLVYVFRLIICETPNQTILNEKQALLDSVTLILLYSLFEFNFNFLVIWLLFWSSLGTLLHKHKEQNAPQYRTTTAAIILLGIYYLLSIVSTAAEATTHSALPAAIIEPYNVDKIIRATNEATEKKLLLPVWIQQSVLVFHRSNPEALISLAKYTNAQHAPNWNLYQRMIETDPQNIDYLSQYITALLDNNEQSQIGKLLEAKGREALPRSSLSTLKNINWSSPVITSLFTKDLLRDVGQPTTVSEYLSKTYYILGFLLLQSDPAATRNLWALARDASPGWGYFHVELASLEHYLFHDDAQARKILIYCTHFVSAAAQCEHTNIIDLSPPSSQFNLIKAIPNLL
jgi:O-antigen ligase